VSTAAPYRDDEDHFADELRLLDHLVRVRTAAFRHELAAAPPAPALYVSHEQVDGLLAGDRTRRRTGAAAHDGVPAALLDDLAAHERRLRQRVRRSTEAGVSLALPRLAARLGLTPFEYAAVVVCLGPELDRGFDTLYAYLQDDITRKRPSVDLVIDLLCPRYATRSEGRRRLAPAAPLLSAEVLQERADPGSPSGSSGLGRMLGLDLRILTHLVGGAGPDSRLAGLVEVVDADPAADLTDEHAAVRLTARAAGIGLLLYLHGPPGSGRRRLARAAAAGAGRALLIVDTASLLRRDDPERLLRLVVREGLLCDAVPYLEGADALFDEPAHPARAALARAVEAAGALVLVGGERSHGRSAELRGVDFHAVGVAPPGVATRAAVWRAGLTAHGISPDSAQEWAEEVARRFRLTPGRIRDAIAGAALDVAAGARPAITAADLNRAALRESRHRLGDLASRVPPRAGWADLVLPPDHMATLREVCAQVRHRDRVLDEWGFGRRGGRARGVSVLFSGPPGTGKTLAVEIIAGELGLDLFRVDLSGVVSKYIGETERNLARVFGEAEASNAVLFFDEADALFGRRTKVSDAHDRYANIETSYLLQRVEEFDGIVVLATNLRDNMDEAFTRRIRFVVDFPFPDESSRRRIWAAHLPGTAPIGSDVDLDRLARELTVAGGFIRNIAVNAAFLAAGGGGPIEMRHVLHAGRREFEKIGKPWEATDAVGVR
jgi:AAA+ superfamily predicted ATPase